MKNIIVCMKQVIDPEAPLSVFHVDPITKRALVPKATPPVMSPFDENALEAALRIKDTQEAKVTVISMGRKLVKAVVRTPLAAGADQLILLEDDSFDDFDTYFTAETLSLGIKKLGAFDLIICGLQAADTNAGQVGPGVAIILGIPWVTSVRKVELIDNKVKVEKVLSEGYETIEVPTPALVTASYEVGNFREPSVEAFMSAGKKPVVTWNAQQLGIAPGSGNRINIINIDQPEHRNKCEVLDGASPEEKAAKLFQKLVDVKVI